VRPATRSRGPKGDRLGGNLAAYRRDPLGFITSCAAEYGDVVALRFGITPALLVNHPDLIEDVLVTRMPVFGRSRLVLRTMRPVAGNGLFTSEGELWRRQRHLLQPLFQRSQLAGYGTAVVTLTEQLLAGWQDGEVRDLSQEMASLTLAIAAKVLFNADLTHTDGGIRAAVTVLLREMNVRLNSLVVLWLPAAFPSPSNLRLRRAVKQLDAALYDLIRRRRAGGADPGDLLSLLLHAHEGVDARAMSDQQVRDELITFLVAGHETTAVALAWAWYLLAQHPEVEARLVDELQAVLGGRVPSVADLSRLPYTQQVLHEVLRLYPPVWALPRDALHNTELGGVRVAAGTAVLLCPWVTQRDPRWYPEPEAFRPERWSKDLANRLPRYAYFPFGGGQRQCIGNGFALQEAALVLATVAQRFRLTVEPGKTVQPEVVLNLRPKPGVPLVVLRR
jgi:cytochrome P450